MKWPGEAARRVYHRACDRMRVQPAEACSAGDVPANVNTARTVGMHAVLHRATPESIAHLKALLDAPVEA